MNDRDRAVKIMINRGVPVEPNEPTESNIKHLIKEIRHRRKLRKNRVSR